jgi:hypothetical protein
MKHLDDVREPTEAELRAIEEEDDDDDFDGATVPPIERSEEYEANQREYESNKHAPADDDDSERARMHRNARDLTRIEHDTTWATISKHVKGTTPTFLPPREHRDKERDRER